MSAQPTPSRPSADRRTSSIQKRQSILPKPSSVVLDPSVLIAQHAQLTGTHAITVGPNTVLHPHSKISSTVAPVVLGEGVVVFERAKVGVGSGDSADADSSRRSSIASTTSNRYSARGEGTVLGRNVVVETGAIVEAAEIGEGSVVEVGAVIGKGSLLGKFCTINASTIVPPDAQLPDFSVVFGPGSDRRIDDTLKSRPQLQQAKMQLHEKQLEMFKKLLPNNVAKWS